MTVAEVKQSIQTPITTTISNGTINVGQIVQVPRKATFVRFNIHDPSARIIELLLRVDWIDSNGNIMPQFTKEYSYPLSDRTLFDIDGNLMFLYSNGNYYSELGALIQESSINKDLYLTEFEYWHYAMAYTLVKDSDLILTGMINLDAKGFFN